MGIILSCSARCTVQMRAWERRGERETRRRSALPGPARRALLSPCPNRPTPPPCPPQQHRELSLFVDRFPLRASVRSEPLRDSLGLESALPRSHILALSTSHAAMSVDSTRMEDAALDNSSQVLAARYLRERRDPSET